MAVDAVERIVANDGFVVAGDIVCLPGGEHLIENTNKRRDANSKFGGEYLDLAMKFTKELASHCPFVLTAAAAGSVSSNGVNIGDDLDFNLIVEDGTKYITYLSAILLGLKYSLRHGEAFGNGGGMRKLICVNVVWTRSDTSPFIRLDDSLAFELMLSRPLIGLDEFRKTLDRNQWAKGAFPQAFSNHHEPISRPPPSLIGRVNAFLTANPYLRQLTDRFARIVSHAIYVIYHWTQKKDGEAVARLELMRKVKYPYEVFQD